MGHNHVQYNKFRNNRDDEQKREENPVEEAFVTGTTVEGDDEAVTPEVEETTEETVAAPVVEETIEEETRTIGVVSGCEKLNVRNRPSTNAAIVTTVKKGDELVLEPCASDEFHKVTLANGVVGYCMKKFITVK